MYVQSEQNPSQGYYSGDCIDMIIEEAEKLYNRFAKEWIESSIGNYAKTVASSLPSLPAP
jgi:hypothetical protein